MKRSEMIVQFIDEYVEEKGHPPTVREIGAAVGLASPSTVHGHLERLQKKGRISKLDIVGAPRTWRNTNTEVRQQHPLGKITQTNRGFDIVEFKDIYGFFCSMQKSSLADKPAIWLGGEEGRMHLDIEQAKLVRDALNIFIETGEI